MLLPTTCLDAQIDFYKSFNRGCHSQMVNEEHLLNSINYFINETPAKLVSSSTGPLKKFRVWIRSARSYQSFGPPPDSLTANSLMVTSFSNLKATPQQFLFFS